MKSEVWKSIESIGMLRTIEQMLLTTKFRQDQLFYELGEMMHGCSPEADEGCEDMG